MQHKNVLTSFNRLFIHRLLAVLRANRINLNPVVLKFPNLLIKAHQPLTIGEPAAIEILPLHISLFLDSLSLLIELITPQSD